MAEGDARTVVLVVDDSPDTLATLTEALERTGAVVLVATDGPGALASAAQIAPDLILLDAVMPGMDGFETCRRLMRLPALAHTPVVFMTGLKETDRIIEGLEAGGVDYVTKPIVIDELLARIRVHIGNARLSRSAYAALDTTGRFLFAADREGRLLWSTPQASRLLEPALEDIAGGGQALPAPVRRWLAAHGEGRGEQTIATAGPMPLTLAFVGRMDRDELLLRVSEERSAADPGALKLKLGVTSREADVLLWIAKGKSNKDIGEILGMSPRTVNKHLEQIYVKLGVENRAAAAAIAVRAID